MFVFTYNKKKYQSHGIVNRAQGCTTYLYSVGRKTSGPTRQELPHVMV